MASLNIRFQSLIFKSQLSIFTQKFQSFCQLFRKIFYSKTFHYFFLLPFTFKASFPHQVQTKVLRKLFLSQKEQLFVFDPVINATHCARSKFSGELLAAKLRCLKVFFSSLILQTMNKLQLYKHFFAYLPGNSRKFFFRTAF